MKTAIMQPYYFPYIGYFQLISAVDLFIVYDNIKYTKKGWMNRNRILHNGKDALISLPLKKGSDSLNVCERQLADEFDHGKLLNILNGAYQRAPYFRKVIKLVDSAVTYSDRNLFGFLHHSLVITCAYLGIKTQIVVSSTIPADHRLKGQDRVLALCEAVGTTSYINSIGGRELYSTEAFRARSINLKFLQSQLIEYTQFGEPFVPWLSIIDVMMFNSPDTIRTSILPNYELT